MLDEKNCRHPELAARGQSLSDAKDHQGQRGRESYRRISG
jgi:hypothetical protein